MLSRSRLTHLRSLRQKKFRNEQKLFVAEGRKIVPELLDSSFHVESVYATVAWQKDFHLKLERADEVVTVNEEELSRISSLVTAQDVLAVARIPAQELTSEKLKKNFSLYLDGVRDPGNMGTLIRIADWFGIQHIICSPDCADVWNPKVVQASMGSLIRVHIHEILPEEFFGKNGMNISQHLPVYGTFLEGKSIYETDFGTKGIIVIGNESSGIRKETESFIQHHITIPSFSLRGEKRAGPESLNAAIAAAITLSEMRRKC
ncbi:MAG: RNA methyltransferase [Bacteroidetes bacterium]|nr:RNA methyltransferase [Bacteroidota bacterium]